MTARMKNLLVILISPLLLSGCIVGTAVNVAGEVVEAGVEVTGAVVGTTVDVVTPDGDDDDEKTEDEKSD